jgi:hypothetical protein
LSIITAEAGLDVGNSFEIAAIATSSSVPELSTWAMRGLALAVFHHGRKTSAAIA